MLQVKKKEKKKTFIAVKKFLLHKVLQIIVKPEIYVICDKYELLCSGFSIANKFLNLIVNLKD